MTNREQLKAQIDRLERVRSDMVLDNKPITEIDPVTDEIFELREQLEKEAS